MDSILEKTCIYLKNMLDYLKLLITTIYMIQNPRILFLIVEKNLNPAYKIIRMFFQDFKRMTPFELET